MSEQKQVCVKLKKSMLDRLEAIRIQMQDEVAENLTPTAMVRKAVYAFIEQQEKKRGL